MLYFTFYGENNNRKDSHSKKTAAADDDGRSLEAEPVLKESSAEWADERTDRVRYKEITLYT